MLKMYNFVKNIHRSIKNEKKSLCPCRHLSRRAQKAAIKFGVAKVDCRFQISRLHSVDFTNCLLKGFQTDLFG